MLPARRRARSWIAVLLQNVLQGIFSAAFLASMLRVTTPILLPSLGALISDRAGVINIGLEGIMLIAAFTGVVFSAYAQDWWGQSTGETVGPWLGMGDGRADGHSDARCCSAFSTCA